MLDNSCTIWLFHYSVRLECPTDPRISRTRKRKTPEPCIIGAVSSLTNLPTSTKSIDGPNRGHGNHHGRVAASCIARVRVADVEIIACSFALAALVVWFEIGVWRTLGGPTPADDVDLTLDDLRGSNRSGKTTTASSEAGHVTRTPSSEAPNSS